MFSFAFFAFPIHSFSIKILRFYLSLVTGEFFFISYMIHLPPEKLLPLGLNAVFTATHFQPQIYVNLSISFEPAYRIVYGRR